MGGSKGGGICRASSGSFLSSGMLMSGRESMLPLLNNPVLPVRLFMIASWLLGLRHE